MSCDVALVAIHPLVLDVILRNNNEQIEYDFDDDYYAACLVPDKDYFILWDTYNGNIPESIWTLIEYIRCFKIPPIITNEFIDDIDDKFQFSPLNNYLNKRKGMHLIVEFL